jgi:putative intracellular protease/amidase
MEQIEPRAVHVLMLDSMADWEVGYAIAGINQPTYQATPGRYAIRTVGLTANPVRTMGGMTILPDMAVDELEAVDSAMLILPGANAWEEEQAAAVGKAREFLEAGVPVAAICGATLGLARGGLLDDRPHTSNAREYLETAPEYKGARHYIDAPAVADGNLITATATAPVDFARRVFERLELYAPPVLDAWYSLYSTGDPSAFYKLMAASAGPKGA